MRICNNCKGLTDYETCPKCHRPTDDISIHQDTEELFEMPDTDKARSVLNKLKVDYSEACENVTKAEKKLRQVINAREYTGNTLIKFWELITTTQEEPIEIQQLLLTAGTVTVVDGDGVAEVKEAEEVEEIES